MKKKIVIIISLLIAAILIIVGICLWNQKQNTILIFQNEAFCFDGITFDVSEAEFIKKSHTKLSETRQGLEGEENIYTRNFIWNDIDHPVTAYYHFSEQGFERGRYEIVFCKDVEDKMFSNITENLLPILAEANTYIHWTLDPFENKFKYTMGQIKELSGKTGRFGEVPGYMEIRMDDDQGAIFRINYYKQKQSSETLYVMELEVYKNSYWKWPYIAEVCWDAEKDYDPQLTAPQKDNLAYQTVRMLRFSGSEIWLTDEEGFCIAYPLSPECEVWVIIDPVQRGIVAYEELVKSEMSDYIRRLWDIGLNEKGEIEHVLEAYQP